MVTFDEMEVFLNFKLKLLTADQTISTEIDYFNTQPLTEAATILLGETLDAYFEKLAPGTEEFFLNTALALNAIDADYYIHMTDVRQLDSPDLPMEEKEKIALEKLLLPIEEIENAAHRAALYQAIAFFAIRQNNPILIKKAVDKLQTFM